MRISLSGLSLTGRLKRPIGIVPPVVGPVVAMQHMQLGAATATSALVSVRAAAAADDIRLRTASNPEMTGAAFTAPVAQDATSLIAKVPLSGMTPGVTRYYQAVINGNPAGPVAQYKPVAEKSAAAFKVAFGSCCEPNNTNGVFSRIAARNPDLLLSLGDTPYIDATTNNPGQLRTAYNNFYAETQLAALLNKTAHAYVWDDHDWAANGGHAGSASGPAAKLVYREYQPHYPLNDAGAIYHSFVRGRVKFVMLDVRSERVGSTFLGTNQMTWLLGEIDSVAADAGLEGLVIATVVPWLSSSDTDTWFGATAQRQQIADKIVERGLAGRTLAIAGDAHMVAYDNGTNNQWGGFPVFQAAPWNRANSVKGGPYSAGTFSASNGQYGILDVIDNGTTVTIQCRGYSGTDTQLISADITLSGTKIPAGPPVNTSAPTITGSTVEGQTLTVSSVWSNTSSIARQWKRNGSANIGTNSATYTQVAADVGATITCTETATGSGGTASATSNSVGPVTAAPVVAFGETLQTATGSAPGAANSTTMTMSSPATAGSLLVVAGSFDKESPGFGVSGGGGGWTIQENANDGGGSGVQFAWKIAAGGESGVLTASLVTANNTARPTFAFMEFAGPFDPVPAGAEASNYSVTARTSASATLTTTAAQALALAVVTNDSSGDQLFNQPTAPWVKVAESIGGISACPAILIAKQVVAAGSHGFTGTHPLSDQIALFMVEMKSG